MNRKNRRLRSLTCSKLRLLRLEDRTVPAFAVPMAFPAPSTPIEPNFNGNALIADFDNNSKVDLAILDDASDLVTVLMGNGNGTFQPGLITPTPASPLAFASGDFDADGFDDLVMRHTAAALSIHFGDGDGTFSAPVNINLPYHGWFDNIGLATGDVNGDGLDDVVTSQHLEILTDNFAEINTLLGNADRSFSSMQSPILGDLYNPHFLRMGDFNEDNQLDLIAGMGVHFGNGDGSFAEDNGYGNDEVVGDFNNDGHLDVGAGMFNVQFGNGSGGFSNVVNINTALGGGPPVAGDFNDDGADDVIGLNGQPGVTVLLGAASGPLGPYFNLGVPAGLGSVAVGDFNGDGFDDFAATDSAAGVVRVFLNDGNWTGGTMPALPTINISDVTVTEGNTGSKSAGFKVSLTSAWTETITVKFATANGSATAADFQSVAGTVTFLPGETSKPVNVLVNGDRLPEATETFSVNLSTPTNATIADGQGTGTILDDEPRVSINDVTQYEGKNKATTQFVFTVTLSAAYDQAVTMSYKTANGTASAGSDYTSKTGTVTFLPGETLKTITINVIGDNKSESNETFFVELYGLSSNALFLDSLGLGTILNDD